MSKDSNSSELDAEHQAELDAEHHTELVLLKDMSHWERRLYLARSELDSEEYNLDVAIDRYRSYSQIVSVVSALARRYMLEYNESNSTEDLERFELGTETLRIVTEWKEDSRKDITEQRERVQCQRQRVTEIEQKLSRLLRH